MLHLPPILILLQVIAIDLSLAGDNAIAVGIAAAGLPAARRHHAVFLGIAAAAVLRILFAIFAVQLLQITGLMAAGGLILVWVAWRMYRDVRQTKSKSPSTDKIPPSKTFLSAILQIIVADVSMSLDNVLAVAGAARHHPMALVIGLALSVLLVGAAAAWVARLASKHGWVAWAGIAIVLYTAVKMIVEGAIDVMAVMA